MTAFLSAFLVVASAMTPAQWLTLLGMIPTFVKLAEDAAPVVKEGFNAVKNAIVEIEAAKADGATHTEAVATVTARYAVPGWTDEETTKWLDAATHGEG